MPIYEQISANKWKSFLLVFVFFILILALGYVFGAAFGAWFVGMFFAFFIALIMALVGFYAGDKTALAMSGARPASKQEFPHLINTVEGLSIAAGVPKPKVYVIDSPAINAFATGRNPEKASIAVTTGAIQKLNRQELEGVVAHEMSHVKNYDIRLMMLVVILVGTVILISDFMFRSTLWGKKGSNKESNQLELIFIVVALVLAILAPVIAQLIKLAISRKREYLADASGALLTRYPPGLANALKKIQADSNVLRQATKATAHLYISNPLKKGWSQNLFSTHPPIESRIKALEAM